ncbi:hypothetical protein BCR33DRAFT_717510 [Rhizoclosmatium globosum]|uniref:Uncharacterized protein n=1 Tax=Rhizoclosmatium globosum TaxID=329046 RepID=A0A1Y2C8A6_9FUNG|nr:hypothetical protein BCR33DRAFT_717510 [Rhizoclosmatium globosum]|eukprot:ORY43263.1 hypothetical protein BCR33DRAFT_717510 [Rhizoclosmatium globosum]
MAPKNHVFIPKTDKSLDKNGKASVFGLSVPRTSTNDSTSSTKSIKNFLQNLFTKSQ